MGDLASTPAASNRKRLPFRIKMEPRLQVPPKWFPAAVSAGAIVVALVFGGILISLVGGDPFKSYAHIARALLWQPGRLFGYHRQSHPADPGRPGLFGRIPDEIMEYWR